MYKETDTLIGLAQGGGIIPVMRIKGAGQHGPFNSFPLGCQKALHSHLTKLANYANLVIG